ncbi:hypothetical protein ACHQM5_029475 [Ranunculus cassubicifolius]
MDETWKSKCSSSSWTSLPLENAQQKVQNQVERSASSFTHPYGIQDVSSMDTGVQRESMVFNSLNLGSCRSGKPDLGNSFFSLLSGPSAQSQHGVQPLPNSTEATDSSKLRVRNNKTVFTGDNYGVPPVGILPPQRGNNNEKTGAEHFVFPSSAASTSCGIHFPDLHGIHHMGNMACNSDFNQTGFYQKARGNEIRTDLPYPHQGWLSILNRPDAQHNLSQNQPSVTVSAALGSTSTFTRGCPRVFCLATNGELLVSSQGLLGVVCLCHGLQMSVSKFCEHSGSCIVNPGDAVRLESGETVSQWRRHFFPKYGIRVPDDNSGWDWPEKNPATVGTRNCKTTAPNISKNPEMIKVVDPLIEPDRSEKNWNTFVPPTNFFTGESIPRSTFGDTHKIRQSKSQGCSVLTKSGQQSNNFASGNNSFTGERVMENAFGNVMQNTRQKNAQEGCNAPLKSVAGTAQGIFPTPANGQSMHKVQGGPRSVNLQEESGHQSMSDYIGFLTKGDDRLVANQSLASFKFMGTGSDISRGSDLRVASNVEKDGTTSNIELRLGQPSQQNYDLDCTVISAMQPQLFADMQNQKSLMQGPRLHNVNSRVTEESRHFRLVPSTGSEKWNESKLNSRMLATGASANLQPCTGATAMIPHMFFSQPSTLSERNVISRGSNSNSGTLGSALLDERNSTYLPEFVRNRSEGTHQHSTLLYNSHGMDKGKGAQHNAQNSSYSTEKGNASYHTNHVVCLDPFLGISGNNHLPSCTTANERQALYWSQSPRFLKDPSHINNQSDSHGKTSILQGSTCLHHDPLGTTKHPTMSSTTCFPSSEVSAGYSSTNSICRPSLMQLLSNKDNVNVSPPFLDENLGFIALKHTSNPYKQDPTVSRELEREQERGYTRLPVELQQRASTLGFVAREEQKERSYVTAKKNIPELDVQPLQACSYRDSNLEKMAGVIGLRNGCNFSTSSHGTLYLSKEPAIIYSPHGSFISSYVSLKGGSLDHTNTVHFRSILGDTLKPVCSVFDNDHMVHKDKTRNQSENIGRQIPVRIGCDASMWRDVPRKRTEVGNATHVEKPTNTVNARNFDFKTVGERINGTQVAESLNEHQMSNVYSGCSAPAVTDVTFEVNNMDSCSVDVEHYRHVSEHVVDEGSGIERGWSSDDSSNSGRSTETINVSHKPILVKGGKSSPYLSKFSLKGRANNRRLQSSSGLKNVHKRIPTGCSVLESTNKTHASQNVKRKKKTKWKRLDVSVPSSGLSSVQYDSPQSFEDTESHSCSSRGTQILMESNHGWTRTSGTKRKCPTSRKRDLSELVAGNEVWKNAGKKERNDDIDLKISTSSTQKKSKKRSAHDLSGPFPQGNNQRDTGIAGKYNVLGCLNFVSSNKLDTFVKKAKPVVCGEFGILSNGKLGEDQKPAKIVSLDTVLKRATVCSTTVIKGPESVPTIDTKKPCSRKKTKCYGKQNVTEDEGSDSEYFHNVKKHKEEASTSTSSFSDDAVDVEEELPKSTKEGNDTSDRMLKHNTFCSAAPLKSRFKEARKRSLSEIVGKGEDLPSGSFPAKASKRTLRNTFKSHEKLALKRVGDDSNCQRDESSQSITKKLVKEQKDISFLLGSDVFCSVCGSSQDDDNNFLLECKSCLIRVHQACYGISRVPKGDWCCRPCRANSRDNVCVLCGYDGGAMTLAVKSRNVVKSLLEAWSNTSESKDKTFSPLSETSKDELRLLDASGTGYEVESDSVIKPVTEQYLTAKLNSDSQDKIHVQTMDHSTLKVHNSITAGAADPTIKQWVHMVCGLWTAGTRCPNVDTMSAFDVSGVSCPLNSVVCSVCNRPGGSCIKCRMVQCSVHFHPWCAHQKGLLQSEVEGVDKDMVGFYGRCVLHAKDHVSETVVHPVDTDLEALGRSEFTCARTEGYSGHKKDEFKHKRHGRSNMHDECLVPQEQIDAWLHINGQKSCARGISKTQTSDIEHDCRKEYARYKQTKGWKNLVVYKSGIHGLGLYTSQFISRGAMVVEYVGEVIGLRVADKREIEYQSGKKLQYKGACYFFRIDKEQIIDATRKGGIARFVNHSCLPNCVAKIISVRNDKKVVFFAERNIYPGEEVTYDYHFNHEDEGEKISCFCGSKNCRQYLN